MLEIQTTQEIDTEDSESETLQTFTVDESLVVEPEQEVCQEPLGEQKEHKSETTRQEIEDLDEPAGVSVAQDILNQISNAEMKVRAREAVVNDLKEQLKEAKSMYDAAVSQLRKLCSQQKNDENRPLLDQDDSVGQGEVDSENEVDQEESVRWRDIPFSNFIAQADIKGLGQKKIDSLNEIVSTLGDFEELRAEASRDNAYLADKLPKGFGESIANEMKKRI